MRFSGIPGSRGAYLRRSLKRPPRKRVPDGGGHASCRTGVNLSILLSSYILWVDVVKRFVSYWECIFYIISVYFFKACGYLLIFPVSLFNDMEGSGVPESLSIDFS
jgi:hypothetical protein